MQPTLASAQEEAAAEALFRSAREAADRGDWVTACDRFEESNRLEPAPGTILNLAKCREELGQIASAWKRYGEVVQKLPAGDPRVAYARDKERSLEPEVPRLVLLRPPGPDAVTVTVNGMSVKSAMFGVSLPFDPGTLSIVVSAAGHEDSVEKVELARGDRVERQLALGPVSDDAPHPAVVTTGPTSGADGTPASTQRTWGFVSLGVGAAGLLAGGSGFIWAAAESSTVDRNCVGDACRRAGFDAAERGQSAVTLGWVGLGVGLLGVGLGSFLLATDDGETVAISARPLWGGAALTVGGTL